MSRTTLVEEDARRLHECVSAGGVAVFPSDTVYGICCDPEDAAAARRMYQLKGRPSRRACAVMFFSLEAALGTLAELSEAERNALEALLPAPLTVLLPNRSLRFAAACRKDPATLGLRVPRLPDAIAALAAVPVPVMQSSANLSGQPDARVLADVPAELREGADLVLDGGELPGVASTVLDLRDLDSEGRWYVLREGPLGRDELGALLSSPA